jgi:hypothetical protein
MLVALEGVGGAEHHDDREHVPLHLQPGVGAVAERISDHRIGGADDAGGKDQEVADVSELLIDEVDRAAQRQ